MKSLLDIIDEVEAAEYSWLLRSTGDNEPAGYFAHVYRGNRETGDAYEGGRSRQSTAGEALECAYLRARRFGNRERVR